MAEVAHKSLDLAICACVYYVAYAQSIVETNFTSLSAIIQTGHGLRTLTTVLTLIASTVHACINDELNFNFVTLRASI